MKRLLFTVALVVTLITPAVSLAQNALPQQPEWARNIFPETSGYFIHPNCLGNQVSNQTNTCGPKEILMTATNVSRVILGMLGSVTLLMFVYGGFTWLTSAGRADAVQKGKNILVGSIVGLIIIFVSSLMVRFVVGALTGQTNPEAIQLFPGDPNNSGDPLEIKDVR